LTLPAPTTIGTSASVPGECGRPRGHAQWRDGGYWCNRRDRRQGVPSTSNNSLSSVSCVSASFCMAAPGRIVSKRRTATKLVHRPGNSFAVVRA
jgi:hypothetical protein